MVLILKSIPMVVMKLVVKESSENLRRRQLFPTPVRGQTQLTTKHLQMHLADLICRGKESLEN
jgi:hypothetical protein